MKFASLFVFSLLMPEVCLSLSSNVQNAEEEEYGIFLNGTKQHSRNNTHPYLRGSINATLMDVLDSGEIRELQQTSVEAFLRSYQSGNRFNDTTLTGITGVAPPGRRPAQVIPGQGPVVTGIGPGVLSAGGANVGTTGLAGIGPAGALASQPGVGVGGSGVGTTGSGVGTTSGSIGNAPAGGGFVGPSGIPAPIVTPGGISSAAAPAAGGIV